LDARTAVAVSASGLMTTVVEHELHVVLIFFMVDAPFGGGISASLEAYHTPV
jgi:hypothetical protein